MVASIQRLLCRAKSGANLDSAFAANFPCKSKIGKPRVKSSPAPSQNACDSPTRAGSTDADLGSLKPLPPFAPSAGIPRGHRHRQVRSERRFRSICREWPFHSRHRSKDASRAAAKLAPDAFVSQNQMASSVGSALIVATLHRSRLARWRR